MIEAHAEACQTPVGQPFEAAAGIRAGVHRPANSRPQSGRPAPRRPQKVRPMVKRKVLRCSQKRVAWPNRAMELMKVAWLGNIERSATMGG